MAFWFVFTVWLVLTAVASAFLLPVHPQSFVAVSVILLAAYLVVFVFPSLRFKLARRLGIRLVAFYLGTFTKTYITETDRKDLTRRYAEAGRPDEVKEYGGQGMTGLGLPDVVYLQWPFYSVAPATTAQLRVPIKVTDGVWTTEQEVFRVVRTLRTITRAIETVTKGSVAKEKETIIGDDERTQIGDWKAETVAERKPSETRTKKVEKVGGKSVETREEIRVETQTIPRIQLVVDGEIFIRLGVNLGPLILAMPDAPLDRPTDKEKIIGLETFLSGKIQPLAFEAIRAGVSGYTRPHRDLVPGLTWEGLADAVKASRELEARVRELLGSQPESILIQSALLRPWDGDVSTSDAGQSAAAFDVVIEHISPKGDELQKAIDKVAVARKQSEAARYDAEGTRQRERGLTDALAERKDRLGIGGDLALAHDFGKGTKADLTLVATDVVAALAAFFQKRRK